MKLSPQHDCRCSQVRSHRRHQLIDTLLKIDFIPNGTAWAIWVWAKRYVEFDMSTHVANTLAELIYEGIVVLR